MCIAYEEPEDECRRKQANDQAYRNYFLVACVLLFGYSIFLANAFQ